jgi:hypothetical protein
LARCPPCGIFALAVFNENKGVLIAVIQDGVSLAQQGPRLVVPGDSRGGRYVSNVVSIRVGRVPDDPVVQFLPFAPH